MIIKFIFYIYYFFILADKVEKELQSTEPKKKRSRTDATIESVCVKNMWLYPGEQPMHELHS